MEDSSVTASSERSLRRRGPRSLCYCPEPQTPVLVVSWTENNPGQRFYGCPNYWVGRKCKYFQCVDDEICERGKVLIPQMRQSILRLEAELSTCKKRERFLTVCLTLALLLCVPCMGVTISMLG